MDHLNTVANILSEKKNEILLLWEMEIKNSIYVDKSVAYSSSTLRNSIPKFLDALVQSVRSGEKSLSPEIIWYAHHHGAERAKSSQFSIENAITEYNILRKTIFIVLDKEIDLSPVARDFIFEAINLGVSKAAAEYVKTQMDRLVEETNLRDKFVFTLSHDLKTPLAAAKMSADLIKRKVLEGPAPDLVTRIIDNLECANNMIENLLDACKIKAGEEIIPDIRKINLVEIAKDTLDNLTTIHGDRFRLKSPPALEAHLCPTGMRRILENLCSNAIKYGSPTDPVYVSIESENHQVSIRVHNKAHPQFALDKNSLFDLFKRGSASQIAGKKGWGIGLTIVKGIAEAHHGEVCVDTGKDGTSFKIKLPIDARIFDTHPIQDEGTIDNYRP